jgi:hypothetical protein
VREVFHDGLDWGFGLGDLFPGVGDFESDGVAIVGVVE